MGGTTLIEPVWEAIIRREQAATAAAEHLREQIADLAEQLALAETGSIPPGSDSRPIFLMSGSPHVR